MPLSQEAKAKPRFIDATPENLLGKPKGKLAKLRTVAKLHRTKTCAWATKRASSR
jgi:hypothetical protein